MVGRDLRGVFVWGSVFLVLFPALGGYPGLLRWTSADKLERERVSNDATIAATFARMRGVPIEQLAKDPQALAIGRVVFEDNCAACHGRDARGNGVVGAPNLIDGNSLYGNQGDTILASILDGRRAPCRRSATSSASRASTKSSPTC
jgi:cytochrome c oxidase cbb3-type subunit 3